jgi:hypothetical protein
MPAGTPWLRRVGAASLSSGADRAGEWRGENRVSVGSAGVCSGKGQYQPSICVGRLRSRGPQTGPAGNTIGPSFVSFSEPILNEFFRLVLAAQE